VNFRKKSEDSVKNRGVFLKAKIFELLYKKVFLSCS